MISNLTKDQWDKKVIELNGSILQSWQWGEFQKSYGLKITRLSSDDYLAQVIETPLLAGKKYLYVPKGPLGNASRAVEELKRLAREDSSIAFSRIEPAAEMDLPRAVKETQPTNNWLVDLEQDETQILTSMKPKTRYNINLAQRKGVVVRQGSDKDLLDVYKLFLETAGRNNFRLHPQQYYLKMYEHLSPENLKVLVAEYKGQPLATMFLTLFGTTATYAHGGSSQTMKETMAPYLLHFEAMKLAKSLGYKFYDFGGIAPEGAGPDHAWSGITRFKKSFGGFEVKYPGSFEVIHSPLWYNVYKQGRSLRNLLRNK